MLAVFSGKTILYIGEDQDVAIEILERKNNAVLKKVNTLADLVKTYNDQKEETEKPEVEAEQILEEAENDLKELLEMAGYEIKTIFDNAKNMGAEQLQNLAKSLQSFGNQISKESESKE